MMIHHALLSGVSAAAITAHLSTTPEPEVPTEPVFARYWRLYMNDAVSSSTGNTLSLSEITLYDGSDVAIDKAGATVTASSTWGGGEVASAAYDGNNGTWWAGPRGSASEDAWLQIDAGEGITVAGFGVVFRNQNATKPTRMWLMYSENGADWFPFSGEVLFKSPIPAAGVTFRLSQLRRMYRVLVEDSHNGLYAGFQDIQFRQEAGVSQSPSGGHPWASGQWGTAESADKAFDGSTSTNWGQGSLPAEIGYVFPNTFGAVEIMLQARSGAGSDNSPVSFQIAYSDNIGLTWNTVYSSAAEPAWASLEQRTYALAATSEATLTVPSSSVA